MTGERPNRPVAADGPLRSPPLNRSVGRLLSDDRYDGLGSSTATRSLVLNGCSTMCTGR